MPTPADHARRVLLVVERLPMLCIDHFWLLTNLRRHRYSCARPFGAVPHAGEGREAHGGAYRRAGVGAVVGAPPKEPLPWAPTPGRRRHQGRAQNDTLFLLNALTDEVLHAARCVMERTAGSYCAYYVRQFLSARPANLQSRRHHPPPPPSGSSPSVPSDHERPFGLRRCASAPPIPTWIRKTSLATSGE